MTELSSFQALDKQGFIITSFKGTSMSPLFIEGRDKVYIVKYDGKLKLKKGDVVLFKRKTGEFVLHRLVKAKNGEYSFCGDNHFIIEKGVKESQILGVCIGYYKSEKYVDFKKSFKYKFYKNTYAKSFLLRKVVIKIKRLFRKK